MQKTNLIQNLTRLVVAPTLLAMAACSTAPKVDEYAGIKIKQVARGVQITGDDKVLFDSGKSDVKSEGQNFVALLAKALNERTKANVLVEGHTDNVGAAAYNQTLSEQRAASIKQALVVRGVNAARIQSAGLGMTVPVVDNSTPEGRQANRRTDVIVLGETVEAMFPKK
jgi:outer membrane protein OmpA-like peptidoglycan-associated protein